MRRFFMIPYYMQYMLPRIAAAMALYLCLLPWRKRRLMRQGLSGSGWREAGLLLFFLFSGGMAVLTLSPEPSWLWGGLVHGYWVPVFGGFRLPMVHRVNLIPFSQGDSLVNILGNVVMFVPFGFFTALLFRGWTWKRAFALGAGLTIFIALWQIAAGRFFDIDDILLNTLGVLCGHWLWQWPAAAAPQLAKLFHSTEMRRFHERNDPNGKCILRLPGGGGRHALPCSERRGFVH